MMAQKPKPKELVILLVLDHILRIYTSSPDAYLWVKTEAPAFGHYFKPDEGDAGHTLQVYPTYDSREVMEYLKSYGKDDIETTEGSAPAE